MRKNISAFTFVELIVVITILAILATISFGTYQSYLSWARDSNRLVQLEDMHDWLELISVSQRLPFPEDLIEIQANTDTFAYQGYAGESVINTIWYDWWGKDPENGNYLTYMLSENQRDFQLLTYLSDISLTSNNQVHAFDYSDVFPITRGKPLWILIQKDTNAPLQSDTAIAQVGSFDIVTWSGNIVAYLTDTNRIDTSKWETLTSMHPSKTCKRILEIWRSKGNAVYTISPDGVTKLRVYCDMETDGGWWTFAGFIDSTTDTWNIRLATGIWQYNNSRKDTDTEYFLPMENLLHTEMMVSINTSDVLLADSTNRLLFLRFWLDSNAYHSDDLSDCSTWPMWTSARGLGLLDGVYTRVWIWEKEYFTWSAWCASWWYVRPNLYSPDSQWTASSRQPFLDELPYTQAQYDSFAAAWNYPVGMYLLNTKAVGSTWTLGARYSSDAWVWMKGDWTSSTVADPQTFWNQAWIYVR